MMTTTLFAVGIVVVAAAVVALLHIVHTVNDNWKELVEVVIVAVEVVAVDRYGVPRILP